MSQLRRWFLWEIFLIGVLFGCAITLLATKAWACDPGSYYDPTHQICQASPPAYQQPYYPYQPNLPYPPSDPRWGQ